MLNGFVKFIALNYKNNKSQYFQSYLNHCVLFYYNTPENNTFNKMINLHKNFLRSRAHFFI